MRGTGIGALMDDTHGDTGRFWIADTEIETVPDPLPSDAEPVPSRLLSLAAERWLGLAAVVAMIGLSDLLMFHYWH